MVYGEVLRFAERKIMSRKYKVEAVKPSARTRIRFGVYGDDGSGKSTSLVRLALGIASVTGEQIGIVDTDGERSRLLADKFSFRVIHLATPHGSRDILGAARALEDDGCSIIGIDDMTVEHEGIGGYHETFNAYVARMVERRARKERKEIEDIDPVGYRDGGWNAAKSARKPLYEWMRQTLSDVGMTFRGREKTNQNHEPTGWAPICGKVFTRPLHVMAFLGPSANGRPTWESRDADTCDSTKLIEALRPYPEVLDEDAGARWARWATGKPAELSDLAKDMVAKLQKCETRESLKQVEEFIGTNWTRLSGSLDNAAVNEAGKAAHARFPQDTGETDDER